MTVPGFTTSVLPPDDPLVREAEPWMNHAKCRFYSDEIAMQEQARKRPNLFMALTLGRSWVARGARNGNLDDLQRAMRLGRLLRQDDVTLDQDETALDLIDTAASAMNGLAVSNRDSKRSAQIGPVIIECATLRLETFDRQMLLNAGQIPRLSSFAKTAADRRFRLAAMRRLDSISAGANTDPQRQAFDALGHRSSQLDNVWTLSHLAHRRAENPSSPATLQNPREIAIAAGETMFQPCRSSACARRAQAAGIGFTLIGLWAQTGVSAPHCWGVAKW